MSYGASRETGESEWAKVLPGAVCCGGDSPAGDADPQQPWLAAARGGELLGKVSGVLGLPKMGVISPDCDKIPIKAYMIRTRSPFRGSRSSQGKNWLFSRKQREKLRQRERERAPTKAKT